MEGVTDTYEVYPYKRKKVQGWRFRFIKTGAVEPMLNSERVYDSPEEAARIAGILNLTCYQGAFTCADLLDDHNEEDR